MSNPFGNEFGPENFPSIPDPSNEETGVQELYPQNLQDEVNESYNHNKVLPRIAGVDYKDDDDTGSQEIPADPATKDTTSSTPIERPNNY